MKRFYLFALAAMLFAACATDDTQDLRPIDAPETLTVGFEGGDDDTRVQLNEAGKTVWTKGDLVSVFYRSDANQKWQFQGETGERLGNLKRVNAGSATETMKRVVVVYPYNENYYINTETYNIEATLPATQTYVTNSYGLDGNLMISSDEFNQISLKSVYGWLKLQLTGNGERVHRITLKGNNGEQVAGLVYINSSNAAMTLAAEMGSADDPAVGGVGGNLIFDDAILTEVTLNCGNGVELGAEATAFYIALPPQTFEKGLTAEITTTDGKIMGQYTDKEIVIERNTIQPMASVTYNGIFKPANNEIYYTNGSTTEVTFAYKTSVFGANIVSYRYNKEKKCWVITFDGDVTKIGDDAFWSCHSLTSVTIPDSVTEIGERAFLNCTSLKAFYGKFASEDNRCLIVNGTLNAFAIGCGATSYTIPDSVTSIEHGAFYYCTSLTSVTIPDSVTEIGQYAFYNCTSLTSVTIPDSVTLIGVRAFYKCTSLTSVTIPDSITEIGEYTFYNCSSMTSVTIGNSVTKIEKNAFSYCISLTSITIPDSVTEIGYGAFSRCDLLKEVNIGNGVTSIGDYAFTDCPSLTSVNIPDGVTSIGSLAFADCSSLTSITIPDSVTEIGSSAFSDCKSLTNVTIPDSVTEIGERVFVNCSSMTAFYGKFASTDNRCLIIDGVLDSFAPAGITSYTIPDSVTSIGEHAFRDCDSLTSVTIGNSVTEIGNGAFYGCHSLTSVNIPDSVTEIGVSAFSDCISLKAFYGKFASEDNRCLIVNGTLHSFAPAGITSYTIPNGVTSIGNGAFYGCHSLISVNIPDSVTSIGNFAFSDCTSLKEVYCKPTTPPTGGSYMFSYYSNNSYVPIGCKIYVPASDDDSIINAYKIADGWSDYASYIEEYDFSAEQ